MTTWWNTDHWHAYEEACGDPPGTRSDVIVDADWKTRIVDLSASTEELWAGVRKSYHSIINGLEDECGTLVSCGRDCGDSVLRARAIHKEAARRSTRPDASWELMAQWVDAGIGMLVEPTILPTVDPATYQRLFGAAYAYFIIHDRWAYYASAASLERNLGLALIWWGMLALKERGVRWCELGWQGQADDDKGKGIEFVRRGFGGRDVPVQLSGRALTEEEWEGAE